MADVSTADWSHTDLSVLYDVFYETGTRLSGTYLDLLRQAKDAGDTEMASFWDSEVFRVDAERRAVDSRDREAIIAAMTAFDHEFRLVRAIRRVEAGVA